MLEDIKRTFGEIFGWIYTVLPEGKVLFISCLVVSFVLALLPWCIFKCVAILVFVVGIFCAFFFRNPVRNTVFAEDEIACPADGTVMSIKEEQPGVTVVRIFLSVFNVHVQRATMDGEVEDVIYTPGKFAFANNPQANNNERNLIKLSRNYKYAHIEQITGAIARRIKCWVKKGETVKKGQLVGLIRFGSQVAVYMHKDAVRVMVKEGQKVQGGVSVLALFK